MKYFYLAVVASLMFAVAPLKAQPAMPQHQDEPGMASAMHHREGWQERGWRGERERGWRPGFQRRGLDRPLRPWLWLPVFGMIVHEVLEHSEHNHDRHWDRERGWHRDYHRERPRNRWRPRH